MTNNKPYITVCRDIVEKSIMDTIEYLQNTDRLDRLEKFVNLFDRISDIPFQDALHFSYYKDIYLSTIEEDDELYFDWLKTAANIIGKLQSIECSIDNDEHCTLLDKIMELVEYLVYETKPRYLTNYHGYLESMAGQVYKIIESDKVILVYLLVCLFQISVVE